MRPVHQRRLLELQRNRLEERAEQPQAERQTERGVGQHQGQARVHEAELFHEDVEGDDDHDGGEHVGEQDQAGDGVAAAERVAGQAVGARSTVAPATARLFSKNRTKGVSAKSRQKLSRVGWSGARRGGVAKISPDGLSEVESIQKSGNAPTRSNTVPSPYKAAERLTLTR